MFTWGEFSTQRPDLAQVGKELLYQHGVGLAFLATVDREGAPRLHPMCPLIDPDGLFAFIIPSPKQRDLLRNGRYAMHSFPKPDNEDVFYLTGLATAVDDSSTRASLSKRFITEREHLGQPAPATTDRLFAFSIASCLVTRTTGHGDPRPVHTVWHGR